MAVEPTLIAGNDIVADFGERNRLTIGCKAAQNESSKNRTADDEHHIRAFVGESFIDDRFHDPRRKGRRCCHYDEAENRESIALEMGAAVFTDDTLEDAGNRFRIDMRMRDFG